MFIIPDVPEIEPFIIGTRMRLLLTFFDVYFDALLSEAIISTRQGTMI